jgi:hypothetical protein
MFLTGAGSSFCAVNPSGLQAPGMGDLWQAVQELVTLPTLNRVIGLIPRAKDIGKNVEKLLTLAKIFASLYDNEEGRFVQKFIEDAETAILARVDFVTEHTDLSHHREIIRKVARRGARKNRAKIFTTNYDLCFEMAAQSKQFVVIDGFSHSMPQLYDRGYFSYDTVRRGETDDAPDYIENVFQFYKLHGSLDWRRGPRHIVRSKSAGDGTPVLIFPRDTKYQEAFEVPYLDMMSAFQTALREPDTTLIVSGFGFNDDHISKPIMAALEANMSLKLVVCDVTFIDDPALRGDPQIVPLGTPMRVRNSYFERFMSLVDIGDQRITLLSGRFEDLASALPDLVAQTERERHFERMQRMYDLQTGEKV